MKTFQDKNRLKGFMSTKTIMQKIFKGILQAKEKKKKQIKHKAQKKKKKKKTLE